MKKRILALTVLLVLLSSSARAAETCARILFINVGKADSALVLNGDRAYLIDAGEKESAPAIIAALNAMGVTRLNGVFLTHTHSDHVGGLNRIAPYVPIDTLYSAEITLTEGDGKNKIVKLAEELSLPNARVSAGDVIDIGNGAYFSVLGPVTLNTRDDNDNSLVMTLYVRGARALFTGDMQYAEEATLIAAGADLKADILKVGNHGNPDATSSAFAASVDPQIAVISTDTLVDHDSANPFVRALISAADIYLTENAGIGVLTEISETGEITAQALGRAPANTGVSIVSASARTQTAVLSNDTDSAIDLSGWTIFSTRGTELFVFPDDSVIAPGATVTVGCDPGYEYRWPDTKVWHKSKDDECVLYDFSGNEIDRLLAETA